MVEQSTLHEVRERLLRQPAGAALAALDIAPTDGSAGDAAVALDAAALVARLICCAATAADHG